MEKLYSPKTISEIKEKYGFALRKTLGQNFLTDKNIVDAIVATIDPHPDDLIIEIGPGIGVISNELAPRCKRYVAIEIDNRLIPILEDTLNEHDNIKIINADVLKVDIGKLIEEEKKESNSPLNRVKIVGNLPYYITTPIIMHILENQNFSAENFIESMTFMMQKEVADRLSSQAGSKEYGAITLAVNFYARCEEAVRVPSGAFMPPPKVASSVVKLIMRRTPVVEVRDVDLYFALIRASFNQRRKTLLNSLMTCGYVESKAMLKEALKAAGIDPGRRGETLTNEEFAHIANTISKMREVI